jgi:flagellin-like hook-associated protein FlgL
LRCHATLLPGNANSTAIVIAATENVSHQAISEIEDTDFAAEASSLSASQALSQSSIINMSYADHQSVSQITTLISQLAR